LLVGVIQASAGVLRLGKFVRLIPHPVMMGFVNGLAIVIFLSQLELFKNNIDGKEQWLAGGELLIMLGLVALTMGIMHFLPKIAPKFPAALTAIIVVAGLTIFGGIDVNTVGSFIRDGGGTGLEGSLPQFQPQIFLLWHTLEGHWGLIISTACLLAAVGLIESLMTLNLGGVNI
jgi:SulP family sulfate permease